MIVISGMVIFIRIMLKILNLKNHPNYIDVNPQSLLPLSMNEFIDEIKTDEEFAECWGDLGPVYGAQWRNWEGVSAGMSIARDMEWGGNNVEDVKYGVDQITNLINDLRTNPDSRRLMVNAWNPGDLGIVFYPPCHWISMLYYRNDIW